MVVLALYHTTGTFLLARVVAVKNDPHPLNKNGGLCKCNVLYLLSHTAVHASVEQ